MDHLKNYELPTYDDPLEKALATKRVSAITVQPFVTVGLDTNVQKAIEILADLEIACLMVEDDGELAGMFSEWDVLHEVTGSREELSRTPVSEVMTKHPTFVFATDTVASTLAAIALHGCRHVPVLDAEGKIQGIVTPRRLVSFLQERIEAAK